MLDLYFVPTSCILIFKLWMTERKATDKSLESHTTGVTEKEKEKVTTLWERTKPFGDCKESLKRYITKRVEIQVYY